jgi:protein-histidine pros-kinase
MRLTTKLAALMLIPIAALLVSYYVSSQALDQLAQTQVEQQANLVMKAAKAARDYTSKEIKPLLKEAVRGESIAEKDRATNPHKFIKQTVPAYCARQILASMFEGDKDFSGYRYKEATDKPTIKEDQADESEKSLISEFVTQLKTEPISKTVLKDGRMYWCFSQPMVVEESCLDCHSTKERASTPEFIKQYGDMIGEYGGKDNIGGFGWRDGEVIAAQVVYVPKEKPREIASQAVNKIGLILLLAGLAMVDSLWLAVNLLVLKPVARLSEMAERISTLQISSAQLPVKGNDEIAQLTRAFNRMSLSLYKFAKASKKS